MSQTSEVLSTVSKSGTLLLHRFEAFTAAIPDQPAVRCVVDGVLRDTSYRELNTLAGNIAARIVAQLDMSADSPLIAIRLPAGLEQVAAILGVWKAGCAYVPLDSSAEREAQIIELTQPSLLIDNAFLATLDIVESPVLLPTLQQAQLAYVMFTSGSTGTPKGVEVSQQNIADLIAPLADDLQLTTNDVWSQTHSFAFGFSVWEIWGALATGACLSIVNDASRKDPRRIESILSEQGVSVLSLTPSGLAQWLALDDMCVPPQLRLLVLSGEAVVPARLIEWFARCPSDTGNASHVRVINTYALTETAGRVCVHEYTAADVVETAVVGQPVAGFELRLLDDQQQSVPVGEVGELYIGGAAVAQGYFADAALTAEKFMRFDGVPHYRSGDLMRQRDDGRFEFVGRIDEQIKLRGYRIEPAEIEAVIRSHPDVRDVAVAAVEREQGEQQLVAWYQLNTATDSSPEFWPSLGEYQIYDELLYDFMTADQVRVDAYQRAFEKVAKDKVVLDIGTGQDALLARLALAAGARKVYAVEVIPEAAERAAKLVKDLGQDDRIIVICGDMQSIEIPEAIDVCAQGIIGNIGSSDGIVPIWNSAAHLFADDFTAVPSRCLTRVAAVELPTSLQDPSFSPLAAGYTETIFEREQRRFDVRLCVRNFPESAKLTPAAEFEDLNFLQPMSADDSGVLRLPFERDGQFDGLLFWTEVETVPGDVVDFLDHQQAWLPVYIPLLDVPVAVAAGDVAEVTWRRETGVDGVFPDYRLHLQLNGETYPEYVSRHHEDAFNRNGFYAQLHRALTEQQSNGADVSLKSWVAEHLPDYMQPSVWQLMAALPLNSNGKLDRAALPAPQNSSAAYQAPETELQQDLADIWSRLLGIEQVGLGQDFFDSGGDSILAVRLTTEIQRLIDDTVFLAAVFGAPEIAALATYLEEQHPEAIAKRYSPGVSLAAAPSLVPRNASLASQPLPLSFAQQSLWFLDRLYPGITAANEQFAIRLNARVDVDRLCNAWQQLVSRHSILHTRFDVLEGEPVQLADRALIPEIELMPDADLHAIALSEISAAFDLQHGPLLKAKLLSDDDTDVLLITVHHILADGLSVELIRDELAALYRGDFLAIPELQFSDFAVWQREQLREPEQHPSMTYWREQLAGADYLLNLPQAESVTGETADALRSDILIPAVVIDALRALAKAQGASLFMTLMAALRVVLSRYTGQQDFLIGSPVTLRQTDQLQDMIGCMVNNIAFRNPLHHVDGELPQFTEVLAAEKAAVLAALDHAGLPFESIVEALDPPREFGRHPLFQALLMYEDRSAEVAVADGVEFAVEVPHPLRPSYWDLEVTLVDAGEKNDLRAILSLHPDRYDGLVAQGIAAAFATLLNELSAGFTTQVDALSVLSAGDQKLLSSYSSSGEAGIAANHALHQLVEEQAGRTPESPALITADAMMSYAELNAAANRVAHGLLAAGVRPQERIGIYMQRSVERCVGILAAFKAGLAIVPLDRSWPLARLKFMVAESELQVLLVDEPEQENQLGSDLPVYRCSDFSAGSDADPGANSAASNPDIELAEDAPAWVLFTSGSTGQPKGVLYSHAAAVHRVRWMWDSYGFDADERFVHRSSINFVDAYWELFGPLTHGAAVVLPPVAADKDPAVLLRSLLQHAVTHLVAVPSLLHTLLELSGVSGESQQLALRSLICSGETLQPDVLQQIRSQLPDCLLFNTYGTTETWDATVYSCQVSELRTGKVPIGQSLPGVSSWALDEQLHPVPPGVWGQLYVGGVGLPLAYVGAAAATPLFVRSKDPLVPDVDLYRTGDLVRWNAGGQLEIGGRCDRQINVRGFRIEPAEIERQLAAHPDVSQAAVHTGIDTNGREHVLAYLVAASAGSEVSSLVLQDFLRGWLPDLIVPTVFVWLNTLPLTPSGKTDYLSLPEPDWQLSGAITTEYVAPLSDTEKTLAGIWQSVLNVEQVGRNDDFFALHGHSLMAAKLMSRVCDAFATDLPLQCLFENPSLRGFAASVDAIRWAMNADSDTSRESGEDREVLRF